MNAFEYQSLDSNGAQKNGVLQADTEKHARQLLRDQKLIPIEISKVENESLTHSDNKLKTSLAKGELPIIIRQLSTLLKAGLPLDEALSTTIEQSEYKNSQKILITLRSKLMEGQTLAYGMSLFPKAFDELITTSVEAGEKSGNLDSVLLRLAEYLESREDMSKQSWTALLYPLILIVSSIFVVTGLMIYIVPKVIQVFESNQAELPAITQVMIAISDFLRSYGIALLIVFIVLMISFLISLKN